MVAEPRRLAPVRRIVRAHLRMWGLGELTDRAVLALTELLANVVKHASDKRCRIVLQTPGLSGALRVAVQDGEAALPRPGEAAELDESGRGLELVRLISDGWGTEPSGEGKTVWFELRADG